MSLTAQRKSQADSADTAQESGVQRADEAGNDTHEPGIGPAHSLGPTVRLPTMQTKLTVGRAGDRYEQEADHVADRVTAGQAAPSISRIPTGGLGTQRIENEDAQAKCDACDSRETAQHKSDEEAQRVPGEPVQREADNQAQSKCDTCESQDAAQREPEENAARKPEAGVQRNADEEAQGRPERPAASESDTAQLKCESCEAQSSPAQSSPAPASPVQTSPDPDATAQTLVQREAEDDGDPSPGAELDPQTPDAGDDTENTEEPKSPDEDDATAADCEQVTPSQAAGAGAQPNSTTDDDEEASQASAAPTTPAAASSSLGCGTEGGGDKEADTEAPAADGAQQSCGKPASAPESE